MLLAQADILMVTDGEIPSPDENILSTIKAMHEDIGLEVHGLIVASQVGERGGGALRVPPWGEDGPDGALVGIWQGALRSGLIEGTIPSLALLLFCGLQVSEPMKKLCTHLHVFKSWTAVGGKDYMA